MRRFYRDEMNGIDLIYFRVVQKETDLYIGADADVREQCGESVRRHRAELEDYISVHPAFARALAPISLYSSAPPIARDMAKAARAAGVGPMAAVAGAFSQYVARDVGENAADILIENGGDLYMRSKHDRIVSVYAGENSLSDKLRMVIRAERMPMGISTSSAKFGHSLSFGKADSVTILSPDAILADAMATAVCNRVRSTDDIAAAIDFAASVPNVSGVIIIINGKIGIFGSVELV